MQPCFHFRFFPGPACLRVFSSSLPSLFPCFPLLSFAFLDFFLFLSFVLRLFSFLLLPFWLGGSCTSVWLVFWVFCCPLLGWGFSSPRVFSVDWGFGSPRVFCLVLLCDFSVLGFGWPRAASARRVHVVLGICPPVSRQLLPAGVVGVGVLLGAVRGHGIPVWCGWVRL